MFEACRPRGVGTSLSFAFHQVTKLLRCARASWQVRCRSLASKMGPVGPRNTVTARALSGCHLQPIGGMRQQVRQTRYLIMRDIAALLVSKAGQTLEVTNLSYEYDSDEQAGRLDISVLEATADLLGRFLQEAESV